MARSHLQSSCVVVAGGRSIYRGRLDPCFLYLVAGADSRCRHAHHARGGNDGVFGLKAVGVGGVRVVRGAEDGCSEEGVAAVVGGGGEEGVEEELPGSGGGPRAAMVPAKSRPGMRG